MKHLISCLLFLFLLHGTVFSQIDTVKTYLVVDERPKLEGVDCQTDSLITRNIIGTFHAQNTRINGISFGAFSSIADKRNVISNGLRLEVPGIGFLSFMGNGFPNARDSSEYNSKINTKLSETFSGLNISTGSWCDSKYNGLSIAIVGQYGIFGNGFAVAGGWNIIDNQKGVQISIIANSSYRLAGVQLSAVNFANQGRGIQIGLCNISRDFKGIQIGLWNINQKRKLPVINWNF